MTVQFKFPFEKLLSLKQQQQRYVERELPPLSQRLQNIQDHIHVVQHQMDDTTDRFVAGAAAAGLGFVQAHRRHVDFLKSQLSAARSCADEARLKLESALAKRTELLREIEALQELRASQLKHYHKKRSRAAQHDLNDHIMQQRAWRARMKEIPTYG